MRKISELNFNKPARLRVQISNRDISFSAEPDKGDPDEDEAITAIEQIAAFFRPTGRLEREMERRTSTGRRVDRIVITR